MSTELGALGHFLRVGRGKGLTSSATAGQKYAPTIHRGSLKTEFEGLSIEIFGSRKEEELI